MRAAAILAAAGRLGVRAMNTQGENVGVAPEPQWEHTAFAGLVPVDLKQLAAQISESYKNFVVLDVNQHCVRLAVMAGEYRWHRHPRSDECFLVIEGELEVDLDGGRIVVLKPGQLFNIPANVKHRTRARVRTVNLCFEDKLAYTDVVFED
jgi:mannose-6-phosphate isomerase-like protein (cupin superfamily)